MALKSEIRTFLEKFGAYKVGVAGLNNSFQNVVRGCNPKNIMENCKSVVVFAFHAGLDYYATLQYYQKDVESRILNIYRDWVCMRLVEFLKQKGYKDMVVPQTYVDEENKIAPLSFKLAAYEAGIGVFGRPSIIITPEFGPRVIFGVVLTNALIPPNKPLTNFNPCQKCDKCVEFCPVKAIDREKPSPTGFNRKKCLEFVKWIRKKTDRKIMFCGYCYNLCPIGEKAEKIFQLNRFKTLLDINEGERKKLLKMYADQTGQLPY